MIEDINPVLESGFFLRKLALHSYDCMNRRKAKTFRIRMRQDASYALFKCLRWRDCLQSLYHQYNTVQY